MYLLSMSVHLHTPYYAMYVGWVSRGWSLLVSMTTSVKFFRFFRLHQKWVVTHTHTHVHTHTHAHTHTHIHTHMYTLIHTLRSHAHEIWRVIGETLQSCKPCLLHVMPVKFSWILQCSCSHWSCLTQKECMFVCEYIQLHYGVLRHTPQSLHGVHSWAVCVYPRVRHVLVCICTCTCTYPSLAERVSC